MPREGEAFVMIAFSLAADTACWWGNKIGSKSDPGQFLGGGRGGGEGVGAMSS